MESLAKFEELLKRAPRLACDHGTKRQCHASTICNVCAPTVQLVVGLD